MASGSLYALLSLSQGLCQELGGEKTSSALHAYKETIPIQCGHTLPPMKRAKETPDPLHLPTLQQNVEASEQRYPAYFIH